MSRITVENLDGFIEEIRRLLNEIRERGTITVYREIDESFYLQKIEELSLLTSQLEAANAQLDGVIARIDKHIETICPSWQKDITYLSFQASLTLCK